MGMTFITIRTSNGYHNFSGSQEVDFFGPGNGNAYLDHRRATRSEFFCAGTTGHGVNQNYDLYLVRWKRLHLHLADRRQRHQSAERRRGSGTGPIAAAMTSGSDAPYGFIVKRTSSNRNINLGNCYRARESSPAGPRW